MNLAEVHQFFLHSDQLVIWRPPELRGSWLLKGDGGNKLLIVIQHVVDGVFPQSEDFIVDIDGHTEHTMHIREKKNH
jgi:hypothetical protein